MVQTKRFGTELNPSGFPMESLIWIKEKSNDCPNFNYVKTFLNPNIPRLRPNSKICSKQGETQ